MDRLRQTMGCWVSLALCAALLGGCATPPPPPFDEALWADAQFAPPSEPVDASALFEVSPAMREFLRREVMPLARREGPTHALVDALNDRARLKLDYDAERTRTAVEAFEARAGNCLSLVVMTAALAQEMGLSVQFQSAVAAELWSQVGDLRLASGHVNVRLGSARPLNGLSTALDLVVDFLPPAAIAGLRVRAIDRNTVVAMYMNNRAAEALANGRLDDAYWWARAATRTGPTLAMPFNTLGVILQRRGDLARAERVYVHALAIDGEHRQSLANLVQLLHRQRRMAEAEPLVQRLAWLEPEPPFKSFDEGLVAMQRGDFAQARELFAREVARAEYQPEFHFWLAQAHWRLGDAARAALHLGHAQRLSIRRDDRERYAGKLQALEALARQ